MIHILFFCCTASLRLDFSAHLHISLSPLVCLSLSSLLSISLLSSVYLSPLICLSLLKYVKSRVVAVMRTQKCFSLDFLSSPTVVCMYNPLVHLCILFPDNKCVVLFSQLPSRYSAPPRSMLCSGSWRARTPRTRRSKQWCSLSGPPCWMLCKRSSSIGTFASLGSTGK